MTDRLAEEAEVVIVGGGPSGSSAAERLTELGHEVLLVDQSGFPRDKPCGDGLTHAAVATLRRRGFDRMLDESQPIEDVRVVLAHDREISGWYRPWPTPPRHARTVPRRALDSALFERAIESGARFLEARVDAPLLDGDELRGVRLTGGAEIRARAVIAADGATSRMRREAGFAREPIGSHVFALRLYATSERPLDPVFDIYVPLLYEGGLLAGYGWVFPVGERRANIGVAYYEPPPGRPRARIRQVLDSFIAELLSRDADRFGGLDQLTEPIGAPIATQFEPGAAQLGRLVLAGEAARAADPLSGEGISFALRSGELAAEEAHALLAGRPTAGQGTEIAHAYTRLGQDLSLLARLAAGAATGLSLVDRAYLPYVHKVQRVTSFAPDEPTLSDTDVYRALSAASPAAPQALDALNERLLDLLRTRFPFALELTHREVRSAGGPLAGALVIGTRLALGGDVRPGDLDAAAALELLALLGGAYSCVADGTTSEAGRANNLLAAMSGPLLLGRALERAVASGNAVAAGMPATARVAIESLSSGAEADGAAALGSLAMRLGAADGPGTGGEQLAEAGASLARAWRICNEIRELTLGDDLIGKPPGDDLRARRPTTPLFHAADADPAIAEGLQGKLDAERVRDLLGRVRASGGLERAADECARHVSDWEAGVRSSGLPAVEVLNSLGRACLDRLSAPG